MQDDGNFGLVEGLRLSLWYVFVCIDWFGGVYLENKLIFVLGYMIFNGRFCCFEVEVFLGNEGFVCCVLLYYGLFVLL